MSIFIHKDSRVVVQGVTGGRGTVKGKTEAIVKAGGKVAKRPSEVGALLKAFLG